MHEQDTLELGDRCAAHQDRESFGFGMLTGYMVIHQRIILARVQGNINAWTTWHLRRGAPDYQPRVIERSI